MIETRDLVKSVDTSEGVLTILKGVSLKFEAGEAVAIVGASGSGKSTLLGLMAGLDISSSGEIILDGHELSSLDEEERAVLRGQLVGFVFQSFQLLPSLTALENVMLPIELKGDAAAREKAVDLLDRVGLTERWHHYPNQLSGGEQQRIAIARALYKKPEIIIFDEATSSLDSKTEADVLSSISQISKNKIVFLVSHKSSSMKICNKVIDFNNLFIK